MHIVGRSVVPVFFLRNEVVDQKYVFEKKIVFLASTNQISAGPTSVWPSFFSNPEKKKMAKGHTADKRRASLFSKLHC